MYATATSPTEVVHKSCEVAKRQAGLLQVEQIAGPCHHVVQLYFFQVYAQSVTCHLRSPADLLFYYIYIYIRTYIIYVCMYVCISYT